MADFSAVRQEDCLEAKLQLPDGCALGSSRTVVLQSVLNEIKEHGRSSMYAEVCGVLVGSLCWDGEPYLLIDGRIEGKHASHQSGSVTFTSETWDFIHEELSAKYPERKIVGWYHTHPGFGIFLSNMDAFIHENFFSFPWEPAYVFDPQAETDGFFFRVGTELVKEDVCVSPDVAPSVKEPQIRNVIPEKIIVESAARWRYVSWVIVVILIICCLSAIAIFAMRKIWTNEEVAKAGEKKAESPHNALTDNGIRDKSHQQVGEGWSVHKETYEQEFDGGRIKVTTITAERECLELSNDEKKVTGDHLISKHADLEKEIRDCETQISNKIIEVNRAKADLDSCYKQLQQLKERRAKEQEKPATRVKHTGEMSPRSDNDISQSTTTSTVSSATSSEIKTEKEHPWYWRFEALIKSLINETTTQKKDEGKRK